MVASARTLVKEPPRYTTESVATMAATLLFGLGSQAVANPLAASTAAARSRITVVVALARTVVKEPPK